MKKMGVYGVSIHNMTSAYKMEILISRGSHGRTELRFFHSP